MGEPKALVRWRGRSFVAHCIATARAVGCEPVLVVQGAHLFPDAELVGSTPIEHAQWSRGQLSSLQAGLTALDLDEPTSPTGVLILTVDRPHVTTDTLTALVGDPSGKSEARRMLSNQ